MKKPKPVSDAARMLGKRGGQTTLQKYGRDQMRAWGKRGAKFGKLGGRPRKRKKSRG